MEATATPDHTWTIAYRKPKANRFQRVADWSGTWQEAVDMARIFGNLHPDLQVWYVPSATNDARVAKLVEAGELGPEYLLDHGAILVDTGRRVRMTETGTIGGAAVALDAERAELAPVIAEFPDGAEVTHDGTGRVYRIDGYPWQCDGVVRIRVERDGVSTVSRVSRLTRVATARARVSDQMAQFDAWPARVADPGARLATLVERDHVAALVENVRRSMGDDWAERAAVALSGQPT
jgi:hypothetical protein